MKSVILFRHGKSDWNANYNDDHERPLAKRGIKASKIMGQMLSKRNEIPDQIISSTALRARTTVELAAKKGKWDLGIKFDKNIYDGSVEILISILRLQNNEKKIICLVGHEPTFSTFITKIGNSNLIKFPTAAMARIDFETERWEKIELEVEKCRLNWFIKPKDLNQ